jgi:uncharacterized membrane protein YkvA (DUF1232 family)
MSFTINLDLSDRDLEPFRLAQKAASESAAGTPEAEVIAAAEKLLGESKSMEVPAFISERLVRLDDLIAMLRDDGWALPAEHRQRVLSALHYFVDPRDIIPDTVPVLGFLDDAIMIELCVRELKVELDTYEEFCDHREREARQRGLDPASIGRADFLEGTRSELLERIRDYREREMGGGYGGSSGWGKSKSFLGSGNSWRPRYSGGR